MDRELYDEISRVAYELWEKEGRVEGRDLEHWRTAEIMIATRLKEGSEITAQTRESCETEEVGEAAAPQRRRRAR